MKATTMKGLKIGGCIAGGLAAFLLIASSFIWTFYPHDQITWAFYGGLILSWGAGLVVILTFIALFIGLLFVIAGGFDSP